MTTEIERLESAINELTREGRILDAIDRYFADHSVFEESDGAQRTSLRAQREHLSNFFASLKSFDGATLHGQATGPDISMSEWTFRMTAGDGSPIIWNEVLVRKWENGKVVSEKYYTA